MHKPFIFLLFLIICPQISNAQLLIGHASTRINFREGPGTQYKIISTLATSNAIVILPRDTINNYLEAFDIEFNHHGYVHVDLITITDTMQPNKQKFFQKEQTKNKFSIQIELYNRTNEDLFIWINGISYDLEPREIKTLQFDDNEIHYFAAAKGIFPVYGLESLMKGYTYKWDFRL